MTQKIRDCWKEVYLFMYSEVVEDWRMYVYVNFVEGILEASWLFQKAVEYNNFMAGIWFWFYVLTLGQETWIEQTWLYFSHIIQLTVPLFCLLIIHATNCYSVYTAGPKTSQISHSFTILDLTTHRQH